MEPFASTRSTQPDATISTDHFTIALAAGEVTTSGGDTLHLTPKEWGLVLHLAHRLGQLVLQHELLSEVWGPDHHDEANLTEPGLGYRLEHANDSP